MSVGCRAANTMSKRNEARAAGIMYTYVLNATMNRILRCAQRAVEKARRLSAEGKRQKAKEKMKLLNKNAIEKTRGGESTVLQRLSATADHTAHTITRHNQTKSISCNETKSLQSNDLRGFTLTFPPSQTLQR